MTRLTGYIMLNRRFLDWQWFTDRNTLSVFLYLLLTANYSPKKWHDLTIERGQAVTSLRSLSEALNLSMSSVRTALDHLLSTNDIASRPQAKFRIITVNNYDYYINSDKQIASKSQANRRQTTGKSQHLNNNKNNKTKEIKESGCGCAANPPSLREAADYFSEKRYTADPEKFCAYYDSIGWRRGNSPITDWKPLADLWQKREYEKPPQQAAYGGYAAQNRTSSFTIEDLEGLDF